MRVNKYVISLIGVVFCGAIFLLSAKNHPIAFNPELNKPYPYEAQILVNTSKNEVYPSGYVQMLMKVDYIITFVNEDLDFYLEIEGLKGFLQPALTRHSSESSKTKYFNTYDSITGNRREEAYKALFIGKKFLISEKKGISVDGNTDDEALQVLHEEGIIQPLIRSFQAKNANFLDQISLKQGSSFELIDSVAVRNTQYLEMANRYLVKDVSKDAIQLTSTGQSRLKRQEIILAQRLILDKNTGMSTVTHQYAQLGDEAEMFTLVKMKLHDAPDILREYEALVRLRLLNASNVHRMESGEQKTVLFDSDPFKSYTAEEQNLRVDRYLDSLILVEDPLNRAILVNPDLIEPGKQLLQGAYVKTGRLKIITEEGDSFSLPAASGSNYYFPISQIGPYASDVFQAQPKVKSCSLDITVFVPTATEEITLTQKRNQKGKYTLVLNDSTFILSYQHEGKRLYTHYPMHGMKCYDKKGNEIEAKLVLIAMDDLQKTDDLQKSEPYTAMELAGIYANQDVANPSQKVAFVF